MRNSKIAPEAHAIRLVVIGVCGNGKFGPVESLVFSPQRRYEWHVVLLSNSS